MNKSKIDWTDYTWNPVTGCRHGCPYCYAEKQTKRFCGDIRLNMASAKRWNDQEGLYVLDKPFEARKGRSIAYPYGFEPTLHTYRMDWPGEVKQGMNIFVCSMADLFGEWVPDEWINQVFAACKKYPQHNYLFLTKNPKRYSQLMADGKLPKRENMWYGSTATRNMTPVFLAEGYKTFFSMEPLLESVDIEYGLPDWVIVGAETGNRKDKVIPQRVWIEQITETCRRAGVPVFMKESVAQMMGDNFVQEFPSQLQREKQLTEKQKAKQHERCSFCKQPAPKKQMIALLTRAGRGQSAMKLGYACPECLKQFEKALISDEPISFKKEDA